MPIELQSLTDAFSLHLRLLRVVRDYGGNEDKESKQKRRVDVCWSHFVSLNLTDGHWGGRVPFLYRLN